MESTLSQAPKWVSTVRWPLSVLYFSLREPKMAKLSQLKSMKSEISHVVPTTRYVPLNYFDEMCLASAGF